MKVAAAIGLLFFAYCALQIYLGWNQRDRASKVIWFLVISTGGGVCLGALLR